MQRSLIITQKAMIRYESLFCLRTISISILFLVQSLVVSAQQKEEADNLVQEGVVFQDKGQVDSAFSRYTMALKMDRYNIAALAEMAYISSGQSL